MWDQKTIRNIRRLKQEENVKIGEQKIETKKMIDDTQDSSLGCENMFVLKTENIKVTLVQNIA